MRLLLIGCTGLVGRGLIPVLQAAGHQLTIVSRSASPAAFAADIAGRLQWIQVDPAESSNWAPSTLLHDALAASDGVVNLAGEPIAEQRWTAQHLETLESSRLATTHHLVSALATLAKPPWPQRDLAMTALLPGWRIAATRRNCGATGRALGAGLSSP